MDFRALIAFLALPGVVAAGFHLRVVYHEEPRLRRQFSAGWAAYSASVPRWLPRVRPWRGDGGEAPPPPPSGNKKVVLA